MYHSLPLQWWHIYARFKVAEDHDEMFVFPHLGQVFGYYRRLRKQTKKEIAEKLSWSEGFVRKVEGSAHQPESLERRIVLARHLQIVPMLMRIPIHLFEEEEPLPDLSSMADLERKNLMASALSVEEKLHRLEESLQKQVPHAFTRSYPLSLESFAIYGEVLEGAQQLFTRERDMDGVYHNILETQDIIPDADCIERTLMERSAQPYLNEQVQLALSNVDFWLEKLNAELQCSRDYRYDQHLFLQYQLCSMVGEVAKYNQDVAAAIGMERSLHYATLAVNVASSLGNAEYAGKALLQRATLYLEQTHYDQALQDLEEMLFYCEVLMDALGDDLVPVFLACSLGQLVWQTKNRSIVRKLQVLQQKAKRIAHITHEDLTRTTG